MTIGVITGKRRSQEVDVRVDGKTLNHYLKRQETLPVIHDRDKRKRDRISRVFRVMGKIKNEPK